MDRYSLCPRDDTTAMPWRALARRESRLPRSERDEPRCAHVMLPRFALERALGRRGTSDDRLGR